MSTINTFIDRKYTLQDTVPSFQCFITFWYYFMSKQKWTLKHLTHVLFTKIWRKLLSRNRSTRRGFDWIARGNSLWPGPVETWGNKLANQPFWFSNKIPKLSSYHKITPSMMDENSQTQNSKAYITWDNKLTNQPFWFSKNF